MKISQVKYLVCFVIGIITSDFMLMANNLEEGLVAFRNQEYQTAIKRLEMYGKNISRSERNLDYVIPLTESYIALKNFKKAFKVLFDDKNNSGSLSESLINVARNREHMGREMRFSVDHLEYWDKTGPRWVECSYIREHIYNWYSSVEDFKKSPFVKHVIALTRSDISQEMKVVAYLRYNTVIEYIRNGRTGTFPKEDFMRAADFGHPEALSDLGYAYENGKDFYGNKYPIDLNSAIDCYLRLCGENHYLGWYNMGHIYSRGESVLGKNINREIESYKRCLNCNPKLSYKINSYESLITCYRTIGDWSGYFESLNNVIKIYNDYRDGKYGNENFVVINAHKSYALAEAYLIGIGCEKDVDEALKWLRISISNDRSNTDKSYGYGLMAYMYQKGIGFEQNEEKSLEMMQNAINAEQSGKMLVYQWGMAYYQSKMYDKALECFENFARNDFVPEVLRQEVLKKLSTMYYFGRGVKEDRGKAKEYAENIIRFGAFADESLAEWQEMILSPDVEE